MKKIMIEVDVPDDFKEENLDVAYVVATPIGIRSLEFRIIEPSIKVCSMLLLRRLK